MLVEGILALTILTIGYNIYRTKNVQRKISLLEEQNKSLTESLMLPPNYGFEEYIYIPHKWEKISSEVISNGFFSMETVCVITERCINCNLIHRYISNGLILAKRKDLMSAEGYYLNGIKCSDLGCGR